MKIQQGVVWSRMVEGTRFESGWLDAYMSCEYDSYRGRGKSARRVTSRYSMMTPRGLFPSGFIPMLKANAPAAGYEIEVESVVQQVPMDLSADLDWLRDYQKQAVMAAAEARHGIIKVPTGGGKTEIFIGLTRVFPVEWLFVCHRGDVVKQSAARYEKRTGEQAGTFSGGVWRRGSSNVTVSTFQAIHRAMKDKTAGVRELFDGIQAINVDEVHAQPAATFYRVSMNFDNASIRIGQSGTPLARDDRSTLRAIGCLGPIVYDIKKRVLVAAGVLSAADIYMPHVRQEAGSAKWRTIYNDLIVNSEVRNDAIAEIALQADKPCLLFVDEFKHGENLKAKMEAKGLSVDFAHGGHWLELRQEKIQHLVSGRTDVLLCTVIFQEGIDIPELASVVNAAGKATHVAALQRLGRGMRVAKGKARFQLWDIWDDGQKWLSRHAVERYTAYRDDGHEVLVGPLEECLGKIGVFAQDEG